MTEQLTVQAGKRYNRRDGEISGEIGHTSNFDFYDHKRGRAYLSNGRSRFKFDEADLISEYKPTPVDVAINHQTVGELYSTYWSGEANTAPPLDPEELHRRLAEVAEPQDEWGPWIGWNGGKCPIDGQVKVQVHAASETRLEAERSDIFKAGEAGWNYIQGHTDSIIAYRIQKHSKTLTDTVWISLATGAVFDCESDEHRGDKEAIITLTDGELDIDWAE